jgi:hypothetical protein
MIKKTIGCASLVLLAGALTGCVSVNTPIFGGIYTDVSGGQLISDSTGSSKVGEATAMGILGVATGDVSIKTAAANGGITKISHVDHHSTSVLGVWGKYTTIVYGE